MLIKPLIILGRLHIHALAGIALYGSPMPFCLRLILVLGLSLFSLQAAATEPRWDPRILQGQLDNGLRYFVYDSGKEADPFNIRLIVHAGSVDEAVPNGIAHILEHMVFQTNAVRGRAMHDEIEALGWRTGLQVNAVTRETETQYMIRTRPDDALNLEGALQFVSDLVLKPALRREDWDKERLVILEELRQTVSLADRVGRLRKAALRTGSRYENRPPIGTHAGISRTSIADIRSFHQQFYRASNMTLIVSGRIDKQEAMQALKRSFGSAPAAEAPNRDYQILPLKRGLSVHRVQDKDGSTSQVTYAFRLPMPKRVTEEGQIAYLQQYFLTRLIRDYVQAEAPYQRDVADSMGFAAQEPTEERLILAFNARTDKHDAATSALLETVERLKRSGLSREGFDALLQRTRKVNENNLEAAESRTFADWEDRIASAVLTGTVVDAPAARTARTGALLDRITFEELNARLREILNGEDRVLFYQMPGGVEAALPTAARVDAERARWAALAELPAREPMAPAPVASAAPAWPADRLVAKSGHLIAERLSADPEVIEWQLSNGDEVRWLVRDTSDGKAYLLGQAEPGFDNTGFASSASQTAVQLYTQSGFAFWSQEEFDLWNDDQPQRWSIELKEGHLGAGVAALPADLPRLLETYASTIAYGAVRSEAVAALKEQMETERVDAAAIQRAELLYGTTEAVDNIEALASLTSTDLTRIAKAHFEQPTIWHAVGPKPDDKIRTAFATVIGAVPRAATIKPKVTLQRPGRHAATVEVFSDDRARVEISVYSDFDWTPEGAFLVSTLTPIAQQSLKKELRNKLGGIYSLDFELKIEPEQDRVIGTLAFFCAPERTEELTKAALAVFDQMPDLVQQADITKIRSDIAFAEETRLTDPNTWLRRLALSYRRYDDAGYLNRMQGLGERITAQRLAVHASHVFRTENVAVLTKLPQSTPVSTGRGGE